MVPIRFPEDFRVSCRVHPTLLFMWWLFILEQFPLKIHVTRSAPCCLPTLLESLPQFFSLIYFSDNKKDCTTAVFKKGIPSVNYFGNVNLAENPIAAGSKFISE